MSNLCAKLLSTWLEDAEESGAAGRLVVCVCMRVCKSELVCLCVYVCVFAHACVHVLPLSVNNVRVMQAVVAKRALRLLRKGCVVV